MTHPILIFALRHKWERLRLCRTAGSVLIDYRILKNYSRRILKKQEPAE